MADLFGYPVVDLAKSTGTRRMGAQPIRSERDERLLSTALSSVSRQMSMNSQPDPTLGAPFSSFPSNRLTVAQMGPGEPAENFPLGAEPRQWKYRVGWNFPTTPDTDRGMSGELLRQLADSSWLIRRCIEIRKAELVGLDWEIVGRGRNGRQRKERAKQNEQLVDYLTDFFSYPEGYFSFTTADSTWYEDESRKRGRMDVQQWRRGGLVDWTDWFSACNEDYFVGDWLTIWPQRTLGNEMLGLRRVDGEHIKALLDLDGRIPPPPMPAWQQYLYGVPRASWAANELYYWPRVLRNMTPYGFSHVQQALVVGNLLLRFDQWNTAAYSDATVPMGILETPAGLSPDQIKDIANFINRAANTLTGRQQAIPVPEGTKWQSIKPFEFSKEYAYYIIEACCACFDLTPTDLGFSPNASAGLGGKGHAEGQVDARRRKTIVPTARWWERKLSRIIQEQWRGRGGEDLEFKFSDVIHDDKQAQYEAYTIGIKSGVVDIDQVIEEQGEKSPGVGRMIEMANGMLFLDQGFAIIGGQKVTLTPPTPEEEATNNATGGGRPPSNTPANADTKKVTDPKADAPSNVPKTTQKMALTKTIDTDMEDVNKKRKKREEEFIAAWVLWWRRRLKKANLEELTVPEQAETLFKLTQDEKNQLSRMLYEELRGPLYQEVFDLLREALHQPETPATEPTRNDILRNQTNSQTQMEQVIQTYHTDLDTMFQRLLAETESNPDQKERAVKIAQELQKWAEERTEWKGKQVAVTESTNAITEAQKDFSIQNPKQLYQWLWRAKMDDKTCDVCASMDGQMLDPNSPFPPAHPNCRCIAIPVPIVRTDGTSFDGYY